MDIASTRARAWEQASKFSSAVAVARHEVERIEGEKQALEGLQAADRHRAEVFSKAIAGVNLILERTVCANLQELSDDVNKALKAIIPDQDLRFEVKPKIMWDKQVYTFAVSHRGIVHSDSDREGIGGTPLTVVSLILRVMFLQYTRRYPLIVLDESIRFISKSHKARASGFIKGLSRAMGVHILLITHDEELAVAADTNYAVTQINDDLDGEHSIIRQVDADTVRAYFQDSE